MFYVQVPHTANPFDSNPKKSSRIFREKCSRIQKIRDRKIGKIVDIEEQGKKG